LSLRTWYAACHVSHSTVFLFGFVAEIVNVACHKSWKGQFPRISTLRISISECNVAWLQHSGGALVQIS